MQKATPFNLQPEKLAPSAKLEALLIALRPTLAELAPLEVGTLWCSNLLGRLLAQPMKRKPSAKREAVLMLLHSGPAVLTPLWQPVSKYVTSQLGSRFSEKLGESAALHELLSAMCPASPELSHPW